MSRVALAGILLILLPLFKRHRKYFLCLIGLAIALSLGACGGGSSGGGGGGGGNTDPGTAAGSYRFTVTAATASGSSLVTTTTQVTLTVNRMRLFYEAQLPLARMPVPVRTFRQVPQSLDLSPN
jgi:hypothetical protein